MKKHKRDPEHRSYVKGYQAAVSGRSIEACPYQEKTQMAYQWSGGGERDVKTFGMDLTRHLSNRKQPTFKYHRRYFLHL